MSDHEKTMNTLIGDVVIRPGDHEATGSYFYGVVDKGSDGKPAFNPFFLIR